MREFILALALVGCGGPAGADFSDDVDPAASIDSGGSGGSGTTGDATSTTGQPRDDSSTQAVTTGGTSGSAGDTVTGTGGTGEATTDGDTTGDTGGATSTSTRTETATSGGAGGEPAVVCYPEDPPSHIEAWGDLPCCSDCPDGFDVCRDCTDQSIHVELQDGTRSIGFRADAPQQLAVHAVAPSCVKIDVKAGAEWQFWSEGISGSGIKVSGRWCFVTQSAVLDYEAWAGADSPDTSAAVTIEASSGTECPLSCP